MPWVAAHCLVGPVAPSGHPTPRVPHFRSARPLPLGAPMSFTALTQPPNNQLRATPKPNPAEFSQRQEDTKR